MTKDCLKIKKKQKGFTLIEIIVVLIILGGLAAISIPSYFSWITRSRAAEAFIMMKSYKDQAYACILARSFSECSGTFNVQTNSFTYNISVQTNGTDINITSTLPDNVSKIGLIYKPEDGTLLRCLDCGSFAGTCRMIGIDATLITGC